MEKRSSSRSVSAEKKKTKKSKKGKGKKKQSSSSSSSSSSESESEVEKKKKKKKKKTKSVPTAGQVDGVTFLPIPDDFDLSKVFNANKVMVKEYQSRSVNVSLSVVENLLLIEELPMIFPSKKCAKWLFIRMPNQVKIRFFRTLTVKSFLKIQKPHRTNLLQYRNGFEK